MDIISKAEETMKRHKMLPLSSVLVGLSGGADSSALIHILYELSGKYGFKVYAAHVNHGLRGETAKRDEEFSRATAENIGAKFFCLHADVRELAKEKGISEELAGREVRYNFFERLMCEHEIDFTATAHHKNDNAETILMNFMRGSGIKGLCGIPYKRGRIIRPLLDISRAEIEGYCEENEISFVTDETNLETVYTRNKVRNIIIPEMERLINPSITDTITKNAAVLATDEDFIIEEAEKAYNENVKDCAVKAEVLNGMHRAVSTRIVRKMTAELCGTEDIPSAVISAVLELAKRNRTGSRADIARGVYAELEYGTLYMRRERKASVDFDYQLKIGESKYIPECGYTVHIERAEKTERDGAEYFGIPENLKEIRIRGRRAGDKFIPFGMNGMKKVKEFMINEKIPRNERSRIGIVTFDGEIAWIVGYRRDNRFKFNKKGIKIWCEYCN